MTSVPIRTNKINSHKNSCKNLHSKVRNKTYVLLNNKYCSFNKIAAIHKTLFQAKLFFPRHYAGILKSTGECIPECFMWDAHSPPEYFMARMIKTVVASSREKFKIKNFPFV